MVEYWSRFGGPNFSFKISGVGCTGPNNMAMRRSFAQLRQASNMARLPMKNVIAS